MANVFSIVITKMQETGILSLLPFLLSFAIFYGLIRKSQIFGDPERNTVVNAIVSFVAALLVWSYPILAGVNLEKAMSTFFVQGMMATLTVMFGLLITSMFLPSNLGEQLAKAFNLSSKGGKFGAVIIVFGVLIGLGIFISSGFVNIFFPSTGSVLSGFSSDTMITIVTIIILAVTVIVIAGIGGGGGESK
jgi:hypothetical protein